MAGINVVSAQSPITSVNRDRITKQSIRCRIYGTNRFGLLARKSCRVYRAWNKSLRTS